MAKYKAQHWLPTGYMKFFTKDGVQEGRKTRIYYSNGVESRIKQVRKLSCANYHYSRDRAEETETSFHQIESEYPNVIKKILKGEELLTREYFGIILTMVDFHARNPSYQNLTAEENYRAFEIVSKGLVREIFGDGEQDFKSMLEFLKSNWCLQPIKCSVDEFISSDHPSIIFSIKDEIAFLFLPINPQYGLVTFDKRKIKLLSNTASETDVANLNGLQAAKCINYVYSNVDLSNEIGEGKPLTKWFARERPKGFVRGDAWKPEYIEYNTTFKDGFGFLSIIQ